MQAALKNALITSAILVSTSACLSSEEKAARRACALDVAGDYTEVREAGVAAGAVVVANESDKNDVKLTFTRGALYDGEQAFLDRLADAADRAELATEVALGVGDDALRRELAGGENISDNFGASSKIDVALERPATPSDGARDAKLRYALALEIENGSAELKGTLTMTFSEQRPNATDGKLQLHSEDHVADVSFLRAAAIDAAQSEECRAIVDGE